MSSTKIGAGGISCQAAKPGGGEGTGGGGQSRNSLMRADRSPGYRALMQKLRAAGIFRSNRVFNALAFHDRRHFWPKKSLPADINKDTPVMISSDASISQPSLVAVILEAAAIQPRETVLEAGYCSGWLLAMIAYLVGEEGRVVGTEMEPALAGKGKANVERFGYSNVECLLVADNHYLTDYQDKFDVVIVSAGLELEDDNTEILRKLIACLKDGGRLIVPIGSRLQLISKEAGKTHWLVIDPGVTFVPFVKKNR